ncbi:probable RNA-binding protein 46 [Periplaneta americana]|uniref:probable RNA-binding protein 46 n=1 Tax=Periplaneta americana TaxID=6978 RepID=UPI0037E98936
MAGAVFNLNDVNSRLLALCDKTGYQILQTNGQRKYGSPPNWSGPPPTKGCEVFVGKLPRDVFEDELVPLFENYGNIYQLRLMMDFSGSNRGFAFIQFSKPSEAEMAVKEMNNYEIRPKRYIGVVKSVDNCRLFVGGLPKNKTKEEVFTELSKIVEGISDVILYSSMVDKRKNRGFAFVEFMNHRAAAMARRKLIPGRLLLWGFELQIDWAIPEPEVDEETMSKVKVLYIRNLLMSTKEDVVWKAMQSVKGGACLERIRKMRDFAFVHFRDRESAEAAMKYWDKKELDGSVIEVSWARPISKKALRQYKHSQALLRPQRPGGVPHGMGMAYAYQTPVLNAFNHSFQPVHSVPAPTGWKPYKYIALPVNVPGMKYDYKATEMLSEWCHRNNWGEPYYTVLPISTPQKEKGFVCRVILPQYPGSQSQFQTQNLAVSPEEARYAAAATALSFIHRSILRDGISECERNAVMPAPPMLPQPETANYTAPPPQPPPRQEVIAYALPPPGYDAQFYEAQYPAQM